MFDQIFQGSDALRRQLASPRSWKSEWALIPNRPHCVPLQGVANGNPSPLVEDDKHSLLWRFSRDVIARFQTSPTSLPSEPRSVVF
jgi:hypothetical protein